jgi:hypothetical protein
MGKEINHFKKIDKKMFNTVREKRNGNKIRQNIRQRIHESKTCKHRKQTISDAGSFVHHSRIKQTGNAENRCCRSEG